MKKFKPQTNQISSMNCRQHQGNGITENLLSPGAGNREEGVNLVDGPASQRNGFCFKQKRIC